VVRAGGLAVVSGFVLAVALARSATSEQVPAAMPAGEALVATPGIHLGEWPALARPSFGPRDAQIEARVAELLAALSLEAKVGQVIQADIGRVTPEQVRAYRLGSVLAGGNAGPNRRDLAPAADWLALADALYDASMSSEGEPRIPVLWGIDAVHGHNNIVGATLFPHNIALGAARNPELVRRIGEITAREIRVTGQDWTFAPALSVARDDRWGRTYESYSEDPELVRVYAAAMIEGLQGPPGAEDFARGEHVLATAKHFVGDGGTFEGRDRGDTRAPESELRRIHAAGYLAAIPAGVQTVMVSYSSWQGAKLHGHAGLLSGVLKQRFGFAGLVVGDWDGHGHVRGCSNASCAAALNAGVDVFMAPGSWQRLFANTRAQVQSGEIPIARLDDAVRRVLRVKLRAGLLEAGRPSSRPLAGRFELLGAPGHRAVARQAVRESLVLLKNEGRLLPLRPDQRVLVTGRSADDVARQSGGWTLTWQGTKLSAQDFPGAQSIWAGIHAAVSAAGGSAELSADGSFAQRPDVAIAVYGEDPYAEYRGDVETLEYRPAEKGDLELLRRLRAAGIPVVSVFLSGRPLWVNPELNASTAFVAAWLPGSEGGGIADVLFRKRDGSVAHDFKGRLAFSWPRTPLQIANRGEPGETPQFAFGYGLTYGDVGDLPRLPEDVVRQAPVPPALRTFYARGEPRTGWQTLLLEATRDGAARRVDVSQEALPYAGSVLTVERDGGSAADVAHALRWNGAGYASFALVADVPLDLQREANSQLSLAVEYRVAEPPSAEVTLAVGCGMACGGSVRITSALRGAPLGAWRTLWIPLPCLERAGAKLRYVETPLRISTGGTLALSLRAARLETRVASALRCTP
jgi:beta-glucosidase